MTYGHNTPIIYHDTSAVPESLRGLIVMAFRRYESYGYFQVAEAANAVQHRVGIRVVVTPDLRKWWKWAPKSYSAMSFSTQWGHDEDLIVIRERKSYDTARLVHLTMHEITHVALNHPTHIRRRTSILFPVTTRRQTLDGGDRQTFAKRFGRGME